MSIRVLTRDENLDRTKEVEDFTRLQVFPRFNEVGTWQIEVPHADVWFFSPSATTGLAPGIVVERDGDVMMSGPAIDIEYRSTPQGTSMVVTGVDDTVWLARRIIYPDPANGIGAQTTASDVQTGNLETLLRYFVDVNAGPSAVAVRQVAGLVLAANQNRGPTLTVRPRLQNLLDRLRGWATHGPLGFQVVQTDGEIEFQVYEPQDRSGEVIFSHQLGNLDGFELRETIPETNAVHVGGGGQGASRVFEGRVDNASVSRYGRIETFKDRRDTSVTAELQDAGDEDLADGASQIEIRISPRENHAFAFGDDYGLGDKVTVRLAQEDYSEIVRSVEWTVDGDGGEVLRPVIGTPRKPKLLRIADRLKRVDERLKFLETTE